MKELSEGARALGIALSDDQLRMFQAYYEMLVAWNARTNLTTIIDRRDVQTKHFLDSLACLAALEGDTANLRLVDVGSGAGFPGLPLRIACPALRLTLVEAAGKKTAFLEAVTRQLGLSSVTVVRARAEEVGHDPAHRETYDLAVVRAVAAMPVLAELALPFVRLGGWLVAQKGDDPAAEVEAAQSAMRTLGGRLHHVLGVTVPGLDAARHLVVVEKVAPTPARYPRRPGMPDKRPLG